MYSRSTRNAPPSMMMGFGVIELRTPYDRQFLDALKSQIDEYARRWDAANKVWRFDDSQMLTLEALCEKHFGVKPTKSGLSAPNFQMGDRVLAEYVGRSTGGKPARVFVAGEFSFLLTEQAIRQYFHLANQTPQPQPVGATSTVTPAPQRTIPDNPYDLLVVTTTATTAEIEQAYRRMARQWHPDVCHEPDAADWFHAITAAKQQLLDSSLRRQLDGALRMKSLLGAQIKAVKTTTPTPTRTEPAKWSADWLTQNANTPSFAPPLRCGWITPAAFTCGAYVKINQIKLWADDIDTQGRTRVAYWDQTSKTIRTDWV